MAHGGARPGAGRPKGSRDAATKAAQATIQELAKSIAPDALEALRRIITGGQSEAAVVAAANSILDRAYGRAVQAVEVSGKDGAPIAFDGWIIDRAQPDPPDAD